ncbi:PspC domain-containing protein, partial [Microbacterium sp. NPDC055599]
MTIPTAPPPPADPDTPVDGAAPSGRTAPRGAERFLLWVAGLGVARSDGWLGGVAAGIAARLRIDPLIVRGVLVVAALFGLPVIFLYAVAWALLPDTDGRVHLRDLLERRYEPVQLGILAMAIVGLLPTAPLTGRLFGLGYESWSALSLFSWIVGLVLAAGLLFLIVRAASRTPGASAPDPPMASAGQAAPGASAPLA